MAEDVLVVQRRLSDLLARHCTAASGLVDASFGAVADGLWRVFLDAWPGLSTTLQEEGTSGRVLGLALWRLAERHEGHPPQLQLLGSLLGSCLEAGLLTLDQLGTEQGSLPGSQGGAGQVLRHVLADFAAKGLRPEGQAVLAQLWKASSRQQGPEVAAAAEQAVQQACLGLAPYLVGQQAAEAGSVGWPLEVSVASARERRRHLAELLAVAGRGHMLPLVDVCTIWWWALDDRGCLAPQDTLPTGWILPEQQQAAEWLLDRLLAQRHVDAALDALHPRHTESCQFLQVLGTAMGGRIQAAARPPIAEGWVWGLLADQLLALGGEPATCGAVGVAFSYLHRAGVKSNWVVWLAAQACLVPCIRQLMLSPADHASSADREGGLGRVLVEVVLGCAEDSPARLLGPPGLMVECLHQRLLADTRQGTQQLHDTLKRAYQGCRVYGLQGDLAGHYRAVDERLGLLDDTQLLLPPAWPLLAAVACVNTQKVSSRLWTLLAEQGTVAHRIPGQGPTKLVGQGPGLPVGLLEQLPPYVQLRLARALQDWLAADRTRDHGRLAPGAVETYARLHYTARAYLGRCMLLEPSPPVDFAHRLLEAQLSIRTDERAGDSHWAVVHTLVELLTWRLGPFLAQYPTKLTRMLFKALHEVGTSEPAGRPRQLLVALEGLVASTLHTVPSKALVVILSVWESWRGGGNPATDLLQHHMRHLLRHIAQAVVRHLAVPGWLLCDPSTVLAALGQLAGEQADLGRDTALGRRCQGLLQALQALDWAPEALAYLPPPLRAHCRHPTNPTGRPLLDHQAWASQQTALVGTLLQADLGPRLQQLARDDMVLCVAWLGLLANKEGIWGPLGRNIAGALRLVTVQQHYGCTERLMDHIVATQAEAGGWGQAVELLEVLLWDSQLLLLGHVLQALAMPTHSGDAAARRLGLAVALLLGPGFSARADCCAQLGIHPRAWLEDDWPARHEAYHQRYPEAFDLADPTQQRPSQLDLPVFYSNTVLRVLPSYGLLLGRLLEHSMEDALLALLARHPALVLMDVAPVRLVYSLLAKYHSAKALTLPVRTALLAPLGIQGLPADAGPHHYSNLVARLAAELGQTGANHDYRFDEADPKLLALQRGVVELLGGGHSAQAVGDGLVGALLQPGCAVGPGAYVAWINTIALLLAHSPTAVRSQLFAQLVHAVATDKDLLANDTGAVDSCPNLARWHPGMRRTEQLLALGQATLLHALQHGTSAAAYEPSMLWAGQLPGLLATVHGSGVVHTDQQLLALCLLVGPSLKLLQPGPAQHGAKGQAGELLLVLFELLVQVDAAKQRAYGKYTWPSPATDRVLDFMYHIRYTYACPDSVYQHIASKLGGLDSSLQARLHFMRRSRS